MTKAFDQLYDFVDNQMRMSHIYQPVMLIHLLENGGKASSTDIAKAILLRDPTQIEYYEEITKRMPGRVLTKNRGITERQRDTYSLRGYRELSGIEVDQLIELCQSRLDQLLEKRKDTLWSYRIKSSGYIKSSLKLRVLGQAKYRCLLCGVSAEYRALEVDHIVPRNHGGADDISNLQALCYSCNAMKRDTDDTDFRGIAESYSHRVAECEFCDPPPQALLFTNELSFSIAAPSPTSKGHTLLVPKRHVEDYLDLYQPELNAIQRNLVDYKNRLQESDATITGFSVGFESGSVVEQAASHCYLNLIPRRGQ